MKNKELLPCPFCGGEAEIEKFYDSGCWFLKCTGCFAQTNIMGTKEMAIDRWNTRTNKIPVGNGKDYEVASE